MKTKHTLESVLADFQLWRQNKTSPRSRIPEKLKHHAVALLADLSPGKITKTLGISRSMLKIWALQQGQSSDAVSAVKFVALPLEPPTETSHCHELTLSLTQANGNHWCLQGNVSASQLNTFIQMAGNNQ